MMEPDASGLFAEADLENLQLSDSEDEMLNEALMTVADKRVPRDQPPG